MFALTAAACTTLFRHTHTARQEVNRLTLEGRDKIDHYFTRHGEVNKWRFALGAVEGQPAMLVFDSTDPMERPAHFVLIDWRSERIIAIRDFLFAPYALEAADWVRLG